MAKVVVEKPQGKPRLDEPRTVAVVGGGIAGLAAATVLSERGARVRLYEADRFLGGRAASFPDQLADGTPFAMERGFHAFFRHYYNLRGLLRRVDPHLSTLVQLDDYPLFGPGGARESFSNLPRRAPWNLASLVWRSPSLRLRDLFSINGNEASAMLAYDPETTYRTYDRMTAGAYLDSLGFPQSARRMLFDVFAHSFFNPEDQFSAAELIMMFHYYFLGNPEGLVFDVSKRPFGPAFWEPLGRYLEDRDAEISYARRLAMLRSRNDGHALRFADGEEIIVDATVLAMDVPGLRPVIEASDTVGNEEFRHRVAQLSTTAPFVVWRLWLDRPVAADRTPFVGTTGLGIIDNISLYHLFEDESAAWVDANGGSVVELHAYGVDPAMSESMIRADLKQALDTLYPELAGARVVEERYLHRRDCPSFLPGTADHRVTVATPDPRLMLAGDFVAMPFPTALMERAASSGMAAANRLLSAWGVQGVPLYSIPLRGMLAGLPQRPSRAASS